MVVVKSFLDQAAYRGVALITAVFIYLYGLQAKTLYSVSWILVSPYYGVIFLY